MRRSSRGARAAGASAGEAYSFARRGGVGIGGERAEMRRSLRGGGVPSQGADEGQGAASGVSAEDASSLARRGGLQIGGKRKRDQEQQAMAGARGTVGGRIRSPIRMLSTVECLRGVVEKTRRRRAEAAAGACYGGGIRREMLRRSRGPEDCRSAARFQERGDADYDKEFQAG
mmetsp:Transcript_17872/g.45343  ORF Transcript_17872/g.45343 Transcript_17872/m.45343 type:complete len:173 (+) Transcript_17872:1038-1556(+)